jgi:hypothetical protein
VRLKWNLIVVGVNESHAATGDVVLSETMQYLETCRRNVLSYCCRLAGLHPSLGDYEKIDAVVSDDVM